MTWRADWERFADTDLAELDSVETSGFATSCFMMGRYRESVDAWDRAHALRLEQGDATGACRCLFWLLLAIGEDDVGGAARMGGYLARIQTLVDEHGLGDLEQAYLLCYAAIGQFMSGQYAEGIEAWSRIEEIGRAHSDVDIWAFGIQGRGRSLLRMGETAKGTAALDELYVAVVSGRLSPMMTGWMYCTGLMACQEAFDVPRAIEWVHSATSWMDQQPGLETYTGVCLIHRSRVSGVRGEWDDALELVDSACTKLSEGRIHHGLGEAHYQKAELLRMRGDHAGAEDSYRLASQHGHDPQPGLALLRLAQGKTAAAAAALRRALEENTEVCRRAELLPARGHVALAEGDLEAAEVACRELAELADRFGSTFLHAEALELRGRLHLAEADHGAALELLRRAHRHWQELDARLQAARIRVHLGTACAALGDAEGADLERRSAREVFEALGAQDDLAALADGRDPETPLSEREIEVVRKVAAGLSNRAVANQLHISEKTVASHLSHIFTKLDVSNRAAVTAYYYEHLIGNQ